MISNNPIPTTADVDRIAALTDPVVRNLRITQCYHELAAALEAHVGGANWCTFATWASRQAGQTIRKEDFERLLENAVQGAPVRPQAAPEAATAAQILGSRQNIAEVQETVWEVINPLGAVDRAADAVGRGNKKVYEEIGREFARFFAVCLNDTALNSKRSRAFAKDCVPAIRPRDRTICGTLSPVTIRRSPKMIQSRAHSSCCWPTSRSAFTSRCASSRKLPRP